MKEGGNKESEEKKRKNEGPKPTLSTKRKGKIRVGGRTASEASESVHLFISRPSVAPKSGQPTREENSPGWEIEVNWISP